MRAHIEEEPERIIEGELEHVEPPLAVSSASKESEKLVESTCNPFSPFSSQTNIIGRTRTLRDLGVADIEHETVRVRRKRKDGSVYEGEVSVDTKKYHGEGKIIKDGKVVYEGSFVDGKYHGKGKLRLKDDSLYVGLLAYGKMSGKGKLIRPDGTYYEGKFSENKPDGKGKIVWTDGKTEECSKIDMGKKIGKTTIKNHCIDGSVLYKEYTTYKEPTDLWQKPY